VIVEQHPAEVQDTDGAPAQVEAVTTEVETVTTWRDALLARLHPADHRISDEDIFAILNEEGDGQTAAELRAAHDVTVPMYCVWKAKYRQLSLEELRQARRREQRRRYTIAGVILLASTLSLGGIAVGLSWAMMSVLMGSASASSTIAAAASALDAGSKDPAPRTINAGSKGPAPRTIDAGSKDPERDAGSKDPERDAGSKDPERDAGSKDPAPRTPAPSRSVVEATAAETGYRIQVTTADTEQLARTAAAKLESAGYPAYVTHVVVNNNSLFRIRVGPFETLPAAEKTANELRAAGYAGVWIAR
jgi:cell division septation protein DedD